MGVIAAHTINFFALAGTEGRVRIQTPDAFEQALTPQDFLQAGDAAGKIVGGIEKCRVAIRDFAGAMPQCGWNRSAAAR